jgi:hypothetical protein
MNYSSINIYWFLMPLTIAISLVYAASRHEAWHRIWKHALRSTLTILAILVVATIVLTVINGFV